MENDWLMKKNLNDSEPADREQWSRKSSTNVYILAVVRGYYSFDILFAPNKSTLKKNSNMFDYFVDESTWWDFFVVH